MHIRMQSKICLSIVFVIILLTVITSCSPRHPKEDADSSSSVVVPESKDTRKGSLGELQNLRHESELKCEHNKVIEASDKILEEDKSNVVSHVSKITALLRLQKKDEANIAFEEFSKNCRDKSDNPEYLLSKANLLIELNECSRAITNFEKVIEQKPDKEIMFKAYKGMGRAFLTMGKYSESIKAFTDAIEISGADSDDEVFIGRSCAYRHLGENEKSVVDMQKAIKLSPEKGYLHLVYANYCMLMDKEEEATEALKKYRESPDFDRNCSSFDQISEKAFSRKKMYYGTLGAIQMEEGKYKEAAENYKKAMKAGSQYMSDEEQDIWLDIGLSYYILGRKGEASENAEKWRKHIINPESTEDFENMAIYEIIKGNREDALLWINKALSEEPEESSFYVTRGILNQYTNHKNEAAADFKTAVAKSNRTSQKKRAELHLNKLKNNS